VSGALLAPMLHCTVRIHTAHAGRHAGEKVTLGSGPIMQGTEAAGLEVLLVARGECDAGG
jgi:hypothetical protein